MERAKLQICLSQFILKHLDVNQLLKSGDKSESNIEGRNKDRLLYDLEHLINQLKDILTILNDSQCKDENSYSNKLKETLQTYSDTDDHNSQNGGVNIVTVSSIDYVPQLDPTLVQVRASKAEMDRRISAFLEKKRMEVNDGNCREFCASNMIESQDNSCARVDALFLKRPDSKGHVKVSKVLNLCGPQQKFSGLDDVDIKPQITVKSEPHDTIHTGMKERIRNMEEHLHIKLDSKRDLAEKIRCLEERILYLESLSPEYFSHSNHPGVHTYPHDGMETFTKHKKMNISEIDERIHFLKQNLKRKASMMIKPEPV